MISKLKVIQNTENSVITKAIKDKQKISVRLPSGDFETGIIYGDKLEFPVIVTESGGRAEFCRATLYDLILGFAKFARF